MTKLILYGLPRPGLRLSVVSIASGQYLPFEIEIIFSLITHRFLLENQNSA